MRWTEDKKKLLWELIFETQTFTLDLQKVSEAWPGDDKPTARAIERHLDNYRKSGSGVSFQKGQKRADTGSGAATPRKRRKTKAAGEIKKAVKEEDDDEEEFLAAEEGLDEN
ncbi:uncharacterized protein BO97DRAFT_425030 [Aspergillus homomorphus CBS 101889]|uniref:Uncharacterized protein n=1 Tax=Aspergillus homomorphus (strain CBS 101889) TaxID=1450537 RepID=A0A395I0P1_ASPHC|nr:hypothetical protein BO97DRAFT_425030 [Aspergillus homomorphus CBS 101889]RAL12104.1 hypothetical protein BO97DRAFT_425030 [Aspergillus homomorphus CBS 101889]